MGILGLALLLPLSSRAPADAPHRAMSSCMMLCRNRQYNGIQLLR